MKLAREELASQILSELACLKELRRQQELAVRGTASAAELFLQWICSNQAQQPVSPSLGAGPSLSCCLTLARLEKSVQISEKRGILNDTLCRNATLRTHTEAMLTTIAALQVLHIAAHFGPLAPLIRFAVSDRRCGNRSSFGAGGCATLVCGLCVSIHGVPRGCSLPV